LFITGGEPLLRKDFAEKYTRAKEICLLVTVFPNGTLIDHEMIALCEEPPPRIAEISLYSGKDENYGGIKGVKGSFQRRMDGIQ
jgi:MoaA/NifB/PqqE/SkfB family radical SAM enzyme